MPSRLKSFELNGYKTFATRTPFEFSDQITAIVGPNGSGKSNIADALRWVLGEQSYSLLRGRKTVDMIFSGSEHRPRAGMASATILFDNSDDWLPIDFSEVSITRRAYRDGQNEYLINGQRVRLKDVSELLSKSGLAERTYTIIGQGLVDVALSLRADERRRLFEEAAGIGLYRARREDALRRLDNTRRNLERVEDILAELRPRLRSLERQARKAQEYEQIREDLRAILREWYGYHWHRAQQELIAAQTAARGRERELDNARLQQAHLDQELAVYREQIHSLRARLSAWHMELTQLHSRREALSRDLAVREERERFLVERRHSLMSDVDRLSQEMELAIVRLNEAAQELAIQQAELDEASTRREAAQGALESQIAARREIEAALLAAREDLARLSARKVEVGNRRTELEARLARQDSLLDAADQALQEVEEVEAVASNLAKERERSLEKHKRNRQEVESELEGIQQRIREVEETRQSTQETLANQREEITRLTTQLEVLNQAEQALIGYASGARLLLEAARQDRLAGVQGALRSHLEVPAELEKAIAAALGDFLDSVVLTSASDIDTALELLKGKEARAAMLVLEDLTSLEPLKPPADPECLGLASELVRVREFLRPAADLLLGRVLVVRERSAARQILKGLPLGSRAVTLAGEVYHVEGQILAGVEGDSGRLGGPRRRRQIMESRASIQQETEAYEAALEENRDRLNALLAERERLETAMRSAVEIESTAHTALRQATVDFDQAVRQVRWRREQRADLAAELEKDRKEVANATEELARMDAGIRETEQLLRERSAELAAASAEDSQVQASHWALEAAVAERARADAQSRQEERQAVVERYEGRLKSARDSLSGLEIELEGLVKEKHQLRQSEEEVAVQIGKLGEQIDPAESELAAAEARHEDFLSEELKSRKALSQAERSYTQAQILLARRQEGLETMRRRVEDDFGLVAFEYEDEISGATPLPFAGMVEQLPRVSELSPEVEEILKRKRLLLRRMGPINPEAQAEFHEVRERYEFLATQLADLKKAEQDVQEVIAELETLMEREFLRTFEAVAVEFREIFRRLFGGGAARLTLTDPAELTDTGIDIEARLPGRREQGLSLLSGGERSLTATALIFALLRVSPTPFCVLDEVDAMLDEVNVGRFRELLRELSRDTQFILITHNRNTVQVADAIYGVTMGRDLSSQVLSLRLEEVDGVYAS